jgi:outer membrane protein TolC
LVAENGRALAKEGLRLIMGLEELPYSTFESLDSLTLSEPSSAEPVDRPEVLAHSAFADAARAQLRAARSTYLPNVNAFASLDRHQGWEYDGDKRTWAAGLSLEWTLFDGLFTSGTISEKHANFKVAEEAARQVRLQTSVELRSATRWCRRSSG